MGGGREELFSGSQVISYRNQPKKYFKLQETVHSESVSQKENSTKQTRVTELNITHKLEVTMLLSKCLRGRHCRLHNSNAIHSKKKKKKC